MKRILTALAITTTLAAAPVMATPYTFTCTRDPGSSVNLRNGPARSYPVVASVPPDQAVIPYAWVWGGDGMRWVRAEVSGLTGWLRIDYICTR